MEFGFRIPIVSCILDSLSWIKNSKAKDSRFQKQKFPGFGMDSTSSNYPDSAIQNRDLTIRQRRRQWKRRWKIDFASFKTFSPFYQVTQLLERREVKLELKRGDRVRAERDSKSYRLAVPVSQVNSKFGHFTLQFCRDCKEIYKKAWCTCRVVVLLIKLIAVLTFPLPSPS